MLKIVQNREVLTEKAIIDKQLVRKLTRAADLWATLQLTHQRQLECLKVLVFEEEHPIGWRMDTNRVDSGRPDSNDPKQNFKRIEELGEEISRELVEKTDKLIHRVSYQLGLISLHTPG